MKSNEVKLLAERMGANVGDLVERLEFVEFVESAINEGRVGFRKGWISSSKIDSDLHPKHWAGLLESMGYTLHPALSNNGRTQLIADEGRTRLFTRENHPKRGVKIARHAVHYYLRDQE